MSKPRGEEGRSLEAGPRNACPLLQCQQPLPQPIEPNRLHTLRDPRNAGMPNHKVTVLISLQLENCQMLILPVWWRSPWKRNSALLVMKSSQASTGPSPASTNPGALMATAFRPSCNGLVALGGQLLVGLLHHFQEAFLLQLLAGPLQLARVLTT